MNTTAMSNYWSYDEGTKEYCFEGKHLHAYYVDPYYAADENGKVEVAFFPTNGCGYTDHIMLDPKVADALIEDIESNPTEYHLQSYTSYDGMKVFSLIHDGKYLEVNGDWVTMTDDDFEEGSEVVNF